MSRVHAPIPALCSHAPPPPLLPSYSQHDFDVNFGAYFGVGIIIVFCLALFALRHRITTCVTGKAYSDPTEIIVAPPPRAKSTENK